MNNKDVKILSEAYRKVLVKEENGARYPEGRPYKPDVGQKTPSAPAGMGLPPNPPDEEQIGPAQVDDFNNETDVKREWFKKIMAKLMSEFFTNCDFVDEIENFEEFWILFKEVVEDNIKDSQMNQHYGMKN